MTHPGMETGGLLLLSTFAWDLQALQEGEEDFWLSWSGILFFTPILYFYALFDLEVKEKEPMVAHDF